MMRTFLARLFGKTKPVGTIPPDELPDYYQVLSVTASIGRKMQMENYGGKKYESEDLFTSVTLKEIGTENLSTHSKDLLRTQMHQEAWRIATEEMRAKVELVMSGTFMSEDKKVDPGNTTMEPLKQYPTRKALTCKEVAEKNGVMKRVYDKMPNSCNVIDQIKAMHKWHITPSGIEKLMMKYDSDDQMLRAALVTLLKLPWAVTTHFAAMGDNIDKIEEWVFDTTGGDKDKLMEWVLADKRTPGD